ncbi:4-hydroxyphenylacetate isomerase [Peribacillus butanolivorans]|uniref:fumarylacetoacetate hydrolase family protein n=1 Tax=Peribacillus butanolivorans TaxID=421767 RepID=UPI0006A6E97E|nr:fumarylacetoacetate hydrolase family protein [Peribacillus butanolivorans]KON71226.1 4-hydroxyphenylacetate isomerase [Peribacillus butanolivorans]
MQRQYEVSIQEGEVITTPLDPPVTGTIYGALLNFKGALEVLGDAVHKAPYQGAPKAPVLYIKPANTLIGHRMAIPVPDDSVELEMGATLGVVIGKTATRVKEEEALSYVSGYTIVNDVSVPHDSIYRPAIKQKARDGFCPVGPWVMPKEAINNPDSLQVKVFINGQLKQENNTHHLIRSVARLISDVTDFMTLRQGDILLTGVPENAPLAKVGDVVRIEIDRIGFLENILVHEKDWNWGGRA